MHWNVIIAFGYETTKIEQKLMGRMDLVNGN